MEHRSSKVVSRRLGQATLEAVELDLELPHHSSHLLHQVERGELEFNMNREELDEFTRHLQRMTNRLALTILLAATIVVLGLAGSLG